MHQTPKIKKIIGELHKASRTHKGQAERLEKILKVIQNVDKKKKDGDHIGVIQFYILLKKMM